MDILWSIGYWNKSESFLAHTIWSCPTMVLFWFQNITYNMSIQFGKAAVKNVNAVLNYRVPHCMRGSGFIMPGKEDKLHNWK